MSDGEVNNLLLDVEGLSVSFRDMDRRYVRVVDNTSLRISTGSTVGLVGESGSGKSVTALSILRLLAEPPARVEGRALLHRPDGQTEDLIQLSPTGRPIRKIRGNEISMIFQEPMRAFSPVFTIGHQVAEGIWRHRKASRTEAAGGQPRCSIAWESPTPGAA